MQRTVSSTDHERLSAELAQLEALTLNQLRARWGYLDSTKVDAAMTPDPITITSRVTAEEAALLILQHKIGGLPIEEDGKVVGIVSTSDLLRALLSVPRAARHIMDD